MIRRLVVGSSLVVALPVLLHAQGGGAPEGRGGGQGGQPPKNLQFFPKEMSRAELTPIMRGIAVSLGVRCNYCHVVTGEAPAGAGGRGGGEQFDYSLDDKDTKKTAREMLRMVKDLNEKYLPAMGRTITARNRVTCETCHHGLAKPQSLVNAIAGAVEAKGADSAVALYRDLRVRYFGRAAYDFGELSLLDAAAEVARMPNQRAAAIALYKLNLEFYPQSVQTYFGLAQNSIAAGDTATAVEALNRGLTAVPDNQQLRNLLNRIRPPR